MKSTYLIAFLCGALTASYNAFGQEVILTVQEKSALRNLKAHINTKNYKKAGATMKRINAFAEAHGNNVLAELEKAEHESQSHHLKAQPGKPMYHLTELVKQVGDILEPIFEKYEKSLEQFAQKFFVHLPQWLKAEQKNRNEKNKTGDWPQFAHQWSTTLDIIHKSSAHDALAQHINLIAPYHKLMRHEMKTKNIFLDAFLKKQGW